MEPVDDSALLRAYCDNQSDDAFAELVARHINLVYSVALRQTGNTSHAEEIAQAVFIVLAKKAGSLRHDKALSSWLFQATRLTANNFIRSERRRQNREQEAHMQSLVNEPDDGFWPQIAPLLDAAVANLNDQDRRAIVLRFYEGKNLRDVGAALALNEEAAKKRVSRALGKLQNYFSKHGIHSTTETIAETISVNSIQTAPALLAKTAAAAAIAKGATASASILTLTKGALKMMMWQQMKTAIAISVAVIFAAGTMTLLAQHKSPVAIQAAAFSFSNYRTNATIPYRMLDDAYQLAASTDQNKIVKPIFIISRNKSLMTSPEDHTGWPPGVHLTIRTTNAAPIPLQLNTNGQILNFPDEETLRQENPLIVSDQPKGSLSMMINFFLPMPDELTFHYSRLSDDVAEVNKAVGVAAKIAKADSYGGFPFRGTVQGVTFVFPQTSAKKATIEIQSMKGFKTYTADANGSIRLKLDKTLIAENPSVILSEKASYVVPDVQ